jgi:archaellum component FlaC
LNERQVLEQIKAIGKDKTRNQDKYYNNCNGTTNRNSFSTSNNNKNDTNNGTGTGGIINESKNALRKLFTSDNDSLERQISRENNNVNEIEKRINELKEQKEMSYQEIKSLTFEYDALIEEKNKIILECHNWAIDIENYKSMVEVVDSSKILIANETMV